MAGKKGHCPWWRGFIAAAPEEQKQIGTNIFLQFSQMTPNSHTPPPHVSFALMVTFCADLLTVNLCFSLENMDKVHEGSDVSVV